METKIRDNNKIQLCEKLGITLIHIPYWWNRNILSLKATIHKKRPDILLSIEDCQILPIPETFNFESQQSSQRKLFNFHFLEGKKIFFC
jgi:hypothetical protein